MIINLVFVIYASCWVCAHCVNTVVVNNTRITRKTLELEVQDSPEHERSL